MEKSFKKIISNATATIIIAENCASHIKQVFKNLGEMVNYMKENDVIYKFSRFGSHSITIKLEKTDAAINNFYENEMRIPRRNMIVVEELPTDMFK